MKASKVDTAAYAVTEQGNISETSSQRFVLFDLLVNRYDAGKLVIPVTFRGILPSSRRQSHSPNSLKTSTSVSETSASPPRKIHVQLSCV